MQAFIRAVSAITGRATAQLVATSHLVLTNSHEGNANIAHDLTAHALGG